MALTPETLPRHELNGLPVRVVDSDDAGRIGLEGRVVVETTNTLHVEVGAASEAPHKRGGNGGARCASDDSSGRSPRDQNSRDGRPRDGRPRDGTAERRTDGESRVVQVPKSGSTFEFAITDDAAGDEKSPGTASELADTQPDADDADDASPTSERAGNDVAYVTVDGSRLLSRPARRTETRGDSPWQ